MWDCILYLSASPQREPQCYGLFTAAAGPVRHARIAGCSCCWWWPASLVFPAGPAARARNNCSVRRRSDPSSSPPPLWRGTMWPARLPSPPNHPRRWRPPRPAPACQWPRRNARRATERGGRRPPLTPHIFPVCCELPVSEWVCRFVDTLSIFYFF